jgi:hypothetical protein
MLANQSAPASADQEPSVTNHPAVWLTLLSALSMSVGWRIRGQIGHEVAGMAGALGAMAIVLLSGRQDWWRRIPQFAMWSALGWAFGGSMSYMKVVAYCQSSDSATVLYGFAGMFLLGFIWAAMGAAGTVLPAVLDSDQLASLYPPLILVLAAWLLQDIGTDLCRMVGRSLVWHDSSWLAATVAVVAVSAYWIWCRRFNLGVSLVLHLALGWWAGMLVFVVLLGLQLNPPRSDNWAGCIGLVAGMLVFAKRHRLRGLFMTTLIAGFVGGSGFALGQMIKMVFESTGAHLTENPHAGWHAIMEWTHGLLFGVTLALVLLPLRRARKLNDNPSHRWTQAFSVFVLLWIFPYLSLRRSPSLWSQYIKDLTKRPYGIVLAADFVPSRGFLGWIEILFVVFGAILVWLLVLHLRRGLLFIPTGPLGRAQLLFLVFLWGYIFISFAHTLVKFTPYVMAIQLAITLHGLLCTAFVLYASQRTPVLIPEKVESAHPFGALRVVAAGLLLAVVVSLSGWGVKRALFGAGDTGYFYMDHIRFGSHNTNNER